VPDSDLPDSDLRRSILPPHPIDLRRTLGALRRGPSDPTMRIGADGVWRATRTPDGPVTTLISARAGAGGGDGNRGLTMRAWGSGAAWALEAFPALVGAEDTGTVPTGDPAVDELVRRFPGLRIGRSQAVVEALVPSILEQKVVGIEAYRSYARLVRTLGEPAPGPAPPGLRVPPAPQTLAATPSYVFHRFGVERRRADTIRIACSCASRLQETVGLAPDDARRRLTALPGVGEWTGAEVALVALGDADAVSVGDYHLPNLVAWALAGEPRADDARMLELLEPFRGQRGRVIRLVVAGRGGPPRRGPRMPLRLIASL
jgi:endonuclease III